MLQHEDMGQPKVEIPMVVDPHLEEVKQQWQELEDTTKSKGEKLFDANHHVLSEQNCGIDGSLNKIGSQMVPELREVSQQVTNLTERR